MSTPGRGVHVPIDGLTGWAEVARRTGEGISAVVNGSVELVQQRARVATAGELADFSERLRVIDQETRAELAEREIDDWDYAWQTTSGPKLTEALNELSPGSREAGHKLAAAYSARASLEAQRDFELQKISKARAQWRKQLDAAVQQGDTLQADQWLDAGEDIFVPRGSMEAQRESVHSQASVARWQRELSENPLRALGMLRSADESDLPTLQADKQSLARAKSEAARAARSEVLRTLVSCMEDEHEPDAEYMSMAEASGALSHQQVERATQTAAPATPADWREWMRRVDECSDEEEEAQDLMLDIATAAIPIKQRRLLLKRVEMSRSLPLADRLSLSRSLWDLYRDGALGCPDDEAAQEHFADIQRVGMEKLAADGSQGAAQWVRDMRVRSNRWVCFESTENA